MKNNFSKVPLQEINHILATRWREGSENISTDIHNSNVWNPVDGGFLILIPSIKTLFTLQILIISLGFRFSELTPCWSIHYYFARSERFLLKRMGSERGVNGRRKIGNRRFHSTLLRNNTIGVTKEGWHQSFPFELRILIFPHAWFQWRPFTESKHSYFSILSRFDQIHENWWRVPWRVVLSFSFYWTAVIPYFGDRWKEELLLWILVMKTWRRGRRRKKKRKKKEEEEKESI